MVVILTAIIRIVVAKMIALVSGTITAATLIVKTVIVMSIIPVKPMVALVIQCVHATGSKKEELGLR